MPYFDSPDGEWVMRQLRSVCNQISEQAITTLADFDEEGMMRPGSEVRRVTIEVLRELLEWCRPYMDGALVKVTQLSHTTWHLGLLYYGTKNEIDFMLWRAAQLGLQRVSLYTGEVEEAFWRGIDESFVEYDEEDLGTEECAWYSFDRALDSALDMARNGP